MASRLNRKDLTFGEKSARVLQLQMDLVTLGYSLPRWGADSIFGRETIEAVEALYEDADRDFQWDEDLPYHAPAWIMELAVLERQKHLEASWNLELVKDVRTESDASRRRRKNRIRAVDTVVLHQMAVKDSDEQGWSRWRSLAIHYVVTCGDNSGAYWLHDPVWRLPHAQAFNSRSVGIECEGYFSGIGTNSRYFWKPKSRPNRKPMTPTEKQLEACRQAVKHAIFRSQQLGGKIKYIGAHRQSYGMKTSDPGELIWRGVAIPLIEEGLVEAFPGTLDHSRYPGRPIPEKWGGEEGVPYR